uniref:Fork-head domain-containing protein n=2 Tax=Denticeps clupeoides TaxID=299321 RepID=A0AAY4D681_9TELE
MFTAGGRTSGYNYSFQRPSQNSHDEAVQSLYPKPIYSYSILIFMALKNSKTGSLPVSEIYSFMTEHFPYFKTAPDGWKNSVRHNLSLNKCFEKVDNKNGSSSRKGCLWTLNPVKVEKMQEELHKWRRKDPVAVRKSMAKPEELDHLLGERHEKFKSPSTHPSHGETLPAAPSYASPRRHSHSYRRSVYQRPPYLPPNPHTFSFYPPMTELPCTGIPPQSGVLESPLPAQTPPSYSAALQAANRGMQELLLEGDVCNDVDTINPSLTELHLHGHLWEELRKDSLAPDTGGVTSAPTSSDLPSPPPRAECLSCGLVGVEDGGGLEGRVSVLNVTGLYSPAYTSTDCLASYLASPGETSVSLL